MSPRTAPSRALFASTAASSIDEGLAARLESEEAGGARRGGRYLLPIDVRLAIWAHKPGYFKGQQILLYRTSDPLDEDAEVTLFIYVEDIEKGGRQYLSGIGTSQVFREAVTDFYGNRKPDFQVGPLESAEKQLIWYGTASDPGRWQFVAEVRSFDTKQLLRRAYAKFVISERPPAVPWCVQNA